ncbi:MAG: TIGR01777 family protein [Planctomycetes bacterium]|nr:TIGR01777 family protein [Planctomycetota bacterium]
MRVLLSGASGFVGSQLARRLRERGHEPLTLGRGPGAAYDWSSEGLELGVRAADAIVHLAGENLFAGRWTAPRKKLLRASRTDTTRALAKLAAVHRPGVFLSASAVGWYGASDARELDERSPRGSGFLAELCAEWEEAAEEALEAGVRTALLRTGVVLGRNGGALSKMLPPFRLGLGGPLGNGKQWVSWIHLDDLCALILWLLEQPKAAGAFNGTAPTPVTMAELARTLGHVLHRPALLPAPAPLLRLALGEVADVLLTGQRVLPRRAQEAGFRFAYPTLEPALRELLGKPEPAAV